MIQVDSLTKDYAGRLVLKDVSFSVEKGEILGFLGPNGAGKTTTMRILTGYLPPTSGAASIAGFDVDKQSLEARRHIGYLPESVPLYRELTVYDYLDFVARLRGISRESRPGKISLAMEKANLNDVSERIIGKLSKGFRQRVGIAQAVIHEPDVMILDEPTEGLDPRQRSDTRTLIRELGKEHTVILSTHILPEVEATCDRVLIINEGSIVASDTPAGLGGKMKRGQRLEVLVVAEDDHVRLAIQSLPGVVSVRTEPLPENRRRVLIEGDPEVELRHLVARALVTADIDLFELRAESISLEDIFLRLTRSDTDTAQDEGNAALGEPAGTTGPGAPPDTTARPHAAGPTLPPTEAEDDE
jgi:ABC-2 type transport system ATP-binding protein